MKNPPAMTWQIFGLMTALIIFAFVAWWALTGLSQNFDMAVLSSITDNAETDGIHQAMRNITSLGSTLVLAIISLLVLSGLLLFRKFGLAVFLLLGFLGGRALTTGLKHLFDRARPDLVPHGDLVYSPALPSGHAMMGTIGFFLLAVIFASLVSGRRIHYYGFFCAAVLAFLIGISRLYLGVHWPTDVVAGWAGGIVWVMACYITSKTTGALSRTRKQDGISRKSG